MRRTPWWLCAILLSACSCESGPSGGPCSTNPPDLACSRSCVNSTNCPPGYHCSPGGRCYAECDARTGDGCRSDEGCTMDGQCIELATAGDARVAIPGMTGDGGDPFVCAEVEIGATRVTPNVIVVVDQSSSMNDSFSGGSRWDVLRDSLLARGGLIEDLQDQVRFGLALFSARAEGSSSGPPIGMCPIVETVPPALNNYAAIEAVYGSAEPIDETPTGDSLDFLLDQLEFAPDRTDDPTIFVLATDGEPDRCEELNPQNGQEESVASVERAYRAGVRTFVISVGRGTVSAEHLQDVANAGLGRRDGEPNAPYWEAGDDDGLRSALREIVGGALSCVVELRGRIEPGMACSGRVELNGVALPCDDPDGWEALDESTIELRGEACDRLQNGAGAELKATFPCDIVLI
ncbi:MAG: VWA domain-containing protein [Sandaracinus sp.]|nr:VWA domain-containing protein [Sandaracinus sp.]MCB9622817.1 VWA domain-containing protein [Sandaracinus sp.]MCB9633895.1 VWA domain-containing protein [Sandaracinus sp.]